MSVILFDKKEVFQKMADSYESLKGFIRTNAYMKFTDEEDLKFYKSLRRLHFANVATYLCQYHDETPENNTFIDPFTELEGKYDPYVDTEKAIASFVNNLGSLEYNLVTNDGGEFVEKDSIEYVKHLAYQYMSTWFDVQTRDSKTHANYKGA